MSNGAGIPPILPGASKPAAPSGQVVQIQTLPEALQNNARALRLEGEVVQQNRDGSTRIRTNEGDIDINVRGKQPQVGQKIEVDIPPGNPPRNATIRPAPLPPQQPLPPVQTQPPVVTQPNIPLPQTPVTKTATPPVTTTNPQLPPQTTPAPVDPKQPLSVTNQAEPKPVATAPQTQPAARLNAGQVVRLIQAATTIPGITGETTNIAGTKITQVAATADMIAQKSQGGLISSLIQSVKSVLTPTTIAPTVATSTGNIGGTITPSIITQIVQPDGTIKTIAPEFAPTLKPAIGLEPDILQPKSNTLVAQLDAKIITIKSPAGQIIANIPDNNGALAKTDIAATPMKIVAPDGTTTIAKPTSIIATVTGFTAQNLPVVTIPMQSSVQTQNFILQTPAANLQQGSQITLSPVTVVPAPGAVLPTALKPLLPLMQAGTLWPAVDDIYQTFFQTTPQAGQIMGRILPSPANPANVGPSALLFAAAIRAGDLQNWMGEKKLEMLQKLGKDSLISRLSGETAPLASRSEAASTDWKSFPVPMLWQNEISKVMLHVRQEPEDKDQPEKGGGTRFIFDLELTKMGTVQLDGMVQGNRINMIVRTQESISYPMQQAMTIAYADALAGTEIYGEITFQGDMKQWMYVTGEDAQLGVDI